MRYMMIVKLTEDSAMRRDYEAGKPPIPELLEAIGKMAGRMFAEGTMLDTGGLLPMAKGALIKATKGKLHVTDGPFIEAKEVIGGYAILKVSSREQAIKLGKEFMQVHLDVLGSKYEGELEVREMAEAPEDSSEHAHCQPARPSTH